jgi:hypothetical protein
MKKIIKLQQGDVIIKSVNSIPDGEKLKHLILSEGEVSGHSHRITSGQAELTLCNNILFLKVLSKKAELTHEEHKTITLPQGNYEITIVKEYDPFLDLINKVRD